MPITEPINGISNIDLKNDFSEKFFNAGIGNLVKNDKDIRNSFIICLITINQF